MRRSSSKSALEAGVSALVAAALLTVARPAMAGSSLLSEEIPITEGNSSWSGQLRRPAGASAIAGIVLLPGDTPESDASLALWADSLAARGVAVLSFGDAEPDTGSLAFDVGRLAGVASRATAAARALREHAAVPDSAVGLLAFGRMTWALPLAASRDPKPAFLISLSGGPIPFGDQEIYRLKQILAADAYEPANVERGASVAWIYFEYLKSGGLQRVVNVQEEYARYRLEPWFPLLEIPRQDPTVGPWSAEQRRLAKALQYDPVPGFAALNVPLLAVLGSEDRVLPVPATAGAYERLRKSGVTVHVIEAADHELSRSLESERRYLAAEAVRPVMEWLLSIVGEASSN